MRRLTTDPFENCEAEGRGRGVTPEPVMSSMLLGDLLLTLVVAMAAYRNRSLTLWCPSSVPMLQQELQASPSARASQI